MGLLELRDRILSLPRLENKMEFYLDEIKKTEEEVSLLLYQYEQESRDVEQIQKGSLSSFMLKFAGKYEDKLEKEQREEINAKLNYDCAIARLEYLVREKDELAARVSALRAEEKTYQVELTDRRKELEDELTEPESILYTELENERKHIISQITEIKEALRAAAQAKSIANEISKSLNSAEGWATWDMFLRGGLISHMAKYSHIDAAEKKFNKLSAQLRELKSELKDVDGLNVSGLSEISSTQRAVDFWFDNIFTDWSVRSQIKDNIEQIRQLLGKVNTVESALESKLTETEKKLAENKRREEELLISIH